MDEPRAPRRGRDRSESTAGERSERSSAPAQVAPEFRDIPTWEEAIGCLSLRTPTEDHARRTENRYRTRDGGGRPPRRR
jgi:hypothetical protein